MRVLLVGKGAPDRGGIPTFLQMLLDSQLARDHELELLNLTRQGDRQGGRFTLANVRRTALDTLAVWHRGGNADVVHVHTALAPTVTAVRAGLLCAAARVRGRAVVLHAHGGLVQHWLDRPWRRRLMSTVLTPAHQVLVVSSAVHESLLATARPDRLRLLDNGVDVESFTPGRRSSPVPRILYVGLLTPRKGVVDLFEASRILLSRGVPHELHVVGGTPDEGAEAEGEVRGAAPSSARLLGPRPPGEMPSIYRDADVFCLPSWWEAAPLSVLEAMASALPVVATDVGDVARLLGSDSGLVVPPRSPNELAAALEKLLTDPSLRDSMGSAGRKRAVEAFSSARTSEELDHIYRDVGTRS